MSHHLPRLSRQNSAKRGRVTTWRLLGADGRPLAQDHSATIYRPTWPCERRLLHSPEIHSVGTRPVAARDLQGVRGRRGKVGLAATGTCGSQLEPGSIGSSINKQPLAVCEIGPRPEQRAGLTSWWGHTGSATGAGGGKHSVRCCTCGRKRRDRGVHLLPLGTRRRILPANTSQWVRRLLLPLTDDQPRLRVGFALPFQALLCDAPFP